MATSFFIPADAGGSGPIPPQVDTTYYVASAPLGDDTNDGLTALTPFLTIGKAESLIPASVEANYQIIVLDDTAPFDAPNFRVRTYPSGSIYLNSVVDNELLAVTSANAGSGPPLIVFTGVVAPEFYDGNFVEVLTGLSTGDIRQIAKTSAYSGTETGLIPVFPFSMGIAALDTFRIFTPSTQLMNGPGHLSLNGAPLGALQTLNLERFDFPTPSVSMIVSGTVALYACTSSGLFIVAADDIALALGGDVNFTAYGPSVFHTLPGTAYLGAGFTWRDGGGGALNSFGFVCARDDAGAGGTIFLAGTSVFLGGGFSQTHVMISTTNALGESTILIAPFFGTGIPVFFSNDGGFDPGITVQGGSSLLCGNLFITTAIGGAPQPCIVVDTGAFVQEFGGSIGVSSGNAIEVNGGLLEFIPSNPSLFATVSGAHAGLLARWGGRAYSRSAAPPVSGAVPGVQDLAVGNVPDYAAAASLAATGDALLPSLTLDGSVIQRTM